MCIIIIMLIVMKDYTFLMKVVQAFSGQMLAQKIPCFQ